MYFVQSLPVFQSIRKIYEMMISFAFFGIFLNITSPFLCFDSTLLFFINIYYRIGSRIWAQTGAVTGFKRLKPDKSVLGPIMFALQRIAGHSGPLAQKTPAR